MKKISYIAACLFALAVSSCGKYQITQTGNYATGVQLKFFHAAPGTPALDGYVNGKQATPSQVVSVTDNFLPTAITTGYIYNGTYPASNYLSAASGSTVIKVVTSTPSPALVSAQTSAPGITISNTTQTTADGEAYSIISSGLPGSTTTPLTSFVVKDVFPAVTNSNTYVRLAHMIPNGTPVDITASYTVTGATAATVTTIITSTGYATITPFVGLPTNTLSSSSYTFQAYLAGTTVKLGTSQLIAMTPGRYYTLVLKGLAADYPVPGTNITLKASARPTAVTDPTRLYPEIYFNAPGLNYYTNK